MRGGGGGGGGGFRGRGEVLRVLFYFIQYNWGDFGVVSPVNRC